MLTNLTIKIGGGYFLINAKSKQKHPVTNMQESYRHEIQTSTATNGFNNPLLQMISSTFLRSDYRKTTGKIHRRAQLRRLMTITKISEKLGKLVVLFTFQIEKLNRNHVWGSSPLKSTD